MPIHFTKHALRKFGVLHRHGFVVSRSQVVNTVESPDIIDESRLPLLIAQKSIDPAHVLRVVYRHEGAARIVITFYPGRKSQYGRNK